MPAATAGNQSKPTGGSLGRGHRVHLRGKVLFLLQFLLVIAGGLFS